MLHARCTHAATIHNIWRIFFSHFSRKKTCIQKGRRNQKRHVHVPIRPIWHTNGLWRSYSNSTTSNNNSPPLLVPQYSDTRSPDHVMAMLQQDMIVYDDFVSEAEEQNLLAEVEPYLARLRYEYSHWDNVSCKWFFQIKAWKSPNENKSFWDL